MINVDKNLKNLNHFLSNSHQMGLSDDRVEAILARIKKHHFSIFEGARLDPLRHAQITCKVGSIAYHKKHEQLTAIHQALLKIRRLPGTVLPDNEDIQWEIIQGLPKDDSIIYKIRALFYAYSEQYILDNCPCPYFPLPDSSNPLQARVNMQYFGRALSNVINLLKNKVPDFTVEDFDHVVPYLIRYDYRLFPSSSFYIEAIVLKKFTHLTSVYVNLHESIASIPFPEKIRTCDLSCLTRTEKGSLAKFTNIQDLHVSFDVRDDFLGLPHPEKLINLSCHSCSDDTLKKLENIQVLEWSGSLECNLALLPHPEKLKKLHCKVYSITQELFAKFVNLESVKVVSKDVLNVVSTSSTIKTLIFNKFTDITLNEYPSCLSVETVYIEEPHYTWSSPISSIDPILNKFPKLKHIHVKSICFFDDSSEKKLTALNIQIHIIEGS